MPLVRTIPPATLALAPATLAEHLRLPHAAPETEQTTELTILIRAATAAIERRLGIAMVAQGWLWRTTRWRDPLPLAPVISVEGVAAVAPDGTRTPWTAWHLRGDLDRPTLAPLPGHPAPAIAQDGHAEIRFTAGHGPDAEAVPEDLRHALTLMAAHYYENREATTDPRQPLPLGVAGLLAPYREVRV